MNGYLQYFRVVLVVVFGLRLITVILCDGLLGDGPPIAGPVDIVIKNIQVCPRKQRGEDGMSFYNMTGFHTKSRPYEYFLTANVSLGFPIDDTVTAELRLAQWTPRGGWKTGIKDMRIPQVCSALSLYAGKMWENVLIAAYGEKVPCPIPPLKHGSFRNVSLNTKNISLREFVYGKWRCDAVILYGTKIKGCVRVYTDIVPPVKSRD